VGIQAEKMPLLAAMQRYIEDGAVGYHTPGHKQGRGIPDVMRRLFTEDGLKMEVSLMGELDDLHAPSSCIKEAQELAAALYGADESYFVVNGTTGAIHAMLMASVGDGEKVLLPRNAHRSAFGGVLLSGARPVYLAPEIDAELGIAMTVTPESVARAVQRNPDAKAALLVYPTYYGVAADLEEIASIVHHAGMLLLVDEAHGPHLKFSDKLPKQALDCGADLVAQSTHKITGALTQCSLLHVKGDRVDRRRVKSMLSLLQSTSPNYLLLASLDAARCQLEKSGGALVERAVGLARRARREINKIDGLFCFGYERLAQIHAKAFDETKLTVNVSGLGISGAAASHILRQEEKIQAELADEYNVLFIISYADTIKEVNTLVDALRRLASRYKGCLEATPRTAVYDELPKVFLTPREAMRQPMRRVAFDESAGCIAGETIAFYPPGVPLICPGEIVSRKLIAYCRSMQALGLKVVGPEDTSLQTFHVIEKGRERER